MNKVCLIGRLTRDAEVKSLEFGNVASLTLALSDGRKNADGSEHTNYIPVIAFGSVADVIAKFTRKGSLVGVEGQLSQRSYEREDKTKVNVVEVVCTSIDLLDKKEVKEETTKAKTKAKARAEA